jgi:FemAB-related protein (PEP-CTERM system-associated)
LPGQFQPLKKNLQLPITTSVCTAGQQEGLVRFIESLSSESNAYQSMVIPRVIEEAFGHQTVTILAHSQGEIVGALALTIIESSLFGNTATSTPFFNYGGPLTEYKDVAEQLITDSQVILAKQGIENIEIRTTFEGLPFPCSSKKVSMVRTLPKSSTELDTQLGSKLRAQINQATEFQPSVKFGGTELLDDFYKVFATNMRDLGTPVYSKKWFLTLLTSASIKTTLVVCYLRGKPVAAGFVFGHNSMLEIPWASTLRRANPMNMNMWMYRQILGFAIEQGYQFFDFGRSTKDASTYKFKKQWGAKPISHYWYYLNRSGKTEGANPDSPKYKLLIAAWKRLPVWLANIIGPPIVKNIP